MSILRRVSVTSLAMGAVTLGSVTLLAGCEPDFNGRISEVRQPTVLAVRSEPAQAAPGAAVSYDVLVASPDGTIDQARVSWSFCNIPKPVAEINDVTTECFSASEDVVGFGSGPTAVSEIPSGACREFGPDIPSTKPGEPPGRPADPDATGGFYQPVVLRSVYGEEQKFDLAQTRLTCANPNGSAEQVKELKDSFIPNANPLLESVTLPERKDAALSAEGSDSPLTVSKGQKLTLRATWPVCPAEPKCGDDLCTLGENATATSCPDDCSEPRGCQGAEAYLYFDPGDKEVVTRHETMRVSWSATGGEFHEDHTGRLESQFDETTSDNTWTAPNKAGRVVLWVVLRDDRGGTDFRSFEVSVQ